jgi:hypothetical protein
MRSPRRLAVRPLRSGAERLRSAETTNLQLTATGFTEVANKLPLHPPRRRRMVCVSDVGGDGSVAGSRKHD